MNFLKRLNKKVTRLLFIMTLEGLPYNVYLRVSLFILSLRLL